MNPARSSSRRPTRRLVWVTLTISCLAAFPPDGVAQDVATSGKDVLDGFWLAVTAGAGAARLTCDLCAPRDLGPSVDIAAGAYASPRLRVGVEAGGWTHLEEELEVRETVYRAGVTAQLHPRADSGLQLIGGFGWSGYRAQAFRYDAARVTVGIAWDLPLAAGLVIGNSITIDAASFGSLRNQDVKVARGVGLSVVRLGVYLRQG
jgi:hypothetical protein